MFVLGPKYHPLKGGQSAHIAELPPADSTDSSTQGAMALFMMMGTGATYAFEISFVSVK